MPEHLSVSLSLDDCDWIYSSFMHRIELLSEWLQSDGPEQVGADNMREELAAANSIVRSLRRGGYKNMGERRRDAQRQQGV